MTYGGTFKGPRPLGWVCPCHAQAALTSMTARPGRKIKLWGLGVGCVWMNMLRR
jgi:hypothetical protein